MNIVKNLVPQSKYNIKCPYEMEGEEIIVHNTANKASAREEISFMIRNDDYTSFHYAVDEKEIVQGIPENRNAFNAGDGANGRGNRKGIAIEICRSYCQKMVADKWVADEERWNAEYREKFLKAEQNAVELIVDILKRNNWGIDRVKKHQDYNNKNCPHRTLELGWNRFLKMIQDKLDEGNTPATKPVEKSVDELAREVLAGKHGNGEQRKKSLGSRYDEVQKRVNEILSGKTTVTKKTVEEIAREVIQGKWGNGTDRKNRLTNAGYNYSEVQKKVNQLLKQ